jgi:16S rRNA (cytidine1402-2'-O)-methyltransferase
VLYIVATPIGNLKDITLRAVEVLKSVDLIACEDTRHSRILLKHYAIETSTTSYYQHNRFTKARYLLEKLKEGSDIALISDAGMPGILDPGYHLVNLAIQNNIPITVIPGSTAFICALGLSGKPIHKFIFEGFLPKKSAARNRRLEELRNLNYTLVFYESCHRILKTLEDIQDVFGDISIVVARELTKKFEEVLRSRVSQIRERFNKARPRGEFVVVI